MRFIGGGFTKRRGGASVVIELSIFLMPGHNFVAEAASPQLAAADAARALRLVLKEPIWMPGKPVMRTTGEINITQTLRGRLKNRMVRDSKINNPCCQDFTP